MPRDRRAASPTAIDVPGRTLTVLLIAAVPIAFLAMAAHDFALVKLHVPYPDESSLPELNRWLSQAAKITGLYLLCRCARSFLRERSALTACLIIGVVNAALCESLRVLIIQTEVFGGTASNLLFSIFDRLPIITLTFYQGASAALIARRSSRPASATAAVAILLAAAMGLYGLQPALQAFSSATEAGLHLGSPQPIYLPPYGFHMYKYIYPTFIEPTLASVFLASIVWPGLPPGSVRRVALYAALLLVARGRMFDEIVNSFWLKMPPPMSFAATGQFFVETLLLAVLTGSLWELVSRTFTDQAASVRPTEDTEAAQRGSARYFMAGDNPDFHRSGGSSG